MQHRADLLVQSYELYFRAIKMNQKQSRMTSTESFPNFWHKNFALVLERLLHVQTPPGMDKIRLCKLSMYHFQQYVDLNPSDPDAPGIKEAIEILKSRLQTFGQLEKVDDILSSVAKQTERVEALTKAAASGSQSKKSP
jgi:hypothetical protein